MRGKRENVKKGDTIMAEEKAVVEVKAEAKKPVAKKPEAKKAEKPAAEKKAAPAKKAEKPAAEKKAAPAKKAEKPAAEKKAAPAKKAEKPAAEKKAAPAKKAEKKAAPAKKADVKANVYVQFAGKSFSQDELVKIAKDVWQYDMNMKAEDFKKVEIYVKPEENTAYFVVNGEFPGSFVL
jgi:hypothetical protein